jgi:CHASE3 domain sensor protein
MAGRIKSGAACQQVGKSASQRVSEPAGQLTSAVEEIAVDSRLLTGYLVFGFRRYVIDFNK